MFSAIEKWMNMDQASQELRAHGLPSNFGERHALSVNRSLKALYWLQVTRPFSVGLPTIGIEHYESLLYGLG